MKKIYTSLMYIHFTIEMCRQRLRLASQISFSKYAGRSFVSLKTYEAQSFVNNWL